MSSFREQPFCAKCNKYFETSSSLLRHKRDIHEPPKVSRKPQNTLRAKLISHELRFAKKRKPGLQLNGFREPPEPKRPKEIQKKVVTKEDLKNIYVGPSRKETPSTKNGLKNGKLKKDLQKKETINKPSVECVQGWMCKTPVSSDDPTKLCGCTFTDKNQILDHVKVKHGDKGRIAKVLIRKPSAPQSETDKKEITKLPKSTSPTDFRSNVDQTIFCSLCSKTSFESFSAFEEHCELSHSSKSLLLRAKLDKKRMFQLFFRCPICQMRTRSKSNLKNHLEKHSLRSKSKLLLRLRNKSELPTIAQSSRKQCPRKTTLPCNFCPLTMPSEKALNQHYRNYHSIHRPTLNITHNYFSCDDTMMPKDNL